MSVVVIRDQIPVGQTHNYRGLPVNASYELVVDTALLAKDRITDLKLDALAEVDVTLISFSS